MKKFMNDKKKVMLALIVLLVAILGVVGYLFNKHILCIHKYTEPTCEEPAYCVHCGLVQQDHLGHLVTDWEVDKEPTCAEKGAQHGTCSRCGRIIYEKIDTYDHTEGDWDISKEPVVNSDGTVTPGTETNYCSKCGKGFKDREYIFELTYEQQGALKKARNLSESVHPGYGWMIEWIVEDGFTKEEAKFAADHCGVDWKEQAVLALEQFVADGESEKECRRLLTDYQYKNDEIEYAMSQFDF